jgi:mono/diheme cytochrome c family protein
MRGAGIAAMALLPTLAFADMTPIPPARQTYLLSCGGCHGLDGVSNAQIVPDLKDQVGFFFNLPEGRRYLARLPNVAFSTNSDQELAALLNYAVFTLGGASVPKGAKPYTAREVSELRKQPLTEVALFQYRQRMVETLIAEYRAPGSLRRYGEDIYGSKSQ